MAHVISAMSSQSNDVTPPPPTKPAEGTVDKNMFLQLLVAQMRNQDPMNPTDGTQFVGQLAQFQQLETGLNTGQDVAAIRADLDALAAQLAKS
jgi:flagellar basal-body rod modification protein FlgD